MQSSRHSRNCHDHPLWFYSAELVDPWLEYLHNKSKKKKKKKKKRGITVIPLQGRFQCTNSTALTSSASDPADPSITRLGRYCQWRVWIIFFFCCHWVWTKKKCRQQCLSAIPGQCKNLPFWNVTFHSAEPDKSRWVFFLLLFVPSYQPIAYQRCVYGSLSIRLEMLLLPSTRLCISCGIHAGAVLDYFISFRNGGLIIFIWAMAVCCPQIAVFTGGV